MAEDRKKGQEDKSNPVQPNKKGKLNNLEMMGIGMFALAFMLYLVSKCSSDETVVTEEPIVIEMNADTAVAATSTDSSAATTETLPRRGSSFSDGSKPVRRATTTTTTTTEAARTTNKVQKLYVSIDSTKLRTGPRLDSAIVSFMRYGDEVINLGEQTELQRIRVSVDEVRTAPWIKVRTKTGQEGWTFGACLQFYPAPVSQGTQN